MADQAVVRRWLLALGRAAAARANSTDVDDFLETMGPMLALRYPDETFNARSLEWVAAECKYLPTYGEIVALLRDWKRQMPAATYPAINDNVVDLEPKDRAWLNYYHLREAEHFAPLREADGRLSRPDITDWRQHTLDVVRHHAWSAWHYLTRNGHAA